MTGVELPVRVSPFPLLIHTSRSGFHRPARPLDLPVFPIAASKGPWASDVARILQVDRGRNASNRESPFRMPRRRNTQKPHPAVLLVGPIFSIIGLGVLVPEIGSALKELLYPMAALLGLGGAAWLALRIGNTRELSPLIRPGTEPSVVREVDLVNLDPIPRQSPANPPAAAASQRRAPAATPAPGATCTRPSPNLASDPELTAQLRAIDWYQFEKLVALLFRAQGFEVQHHGGAREDDGADLVLTRDGKTTIIQCKHWQQWQISKDTVREMMGTREHWKADRCILVSLNGLTQPAAQLALMHQIETVDEVELVRWLKSLRGTPLWEDVQRLLLDPEKRCPRCEAVMVLRTASRGDNAGSQFWGCSTYPRCHTKIPVRTSGPA